jgi:hypothetical protein
MLHDSSREAGHIEKIQKNKGIHRQAMCDGGDIACKCGFHGLAQKESGGIGFGRPACNDSNNVGCQIFLIGHQSFFSIEGNPSDLHWQGR